ncbi:MAG: hypothetical protein WCS42_24420 [Verrucomicrobiota bacterium]
MKIPSVILHRAEDAGLAGMEQIGFFLHPSGDDRNDGLATKSSRRRFVRDEPPIKVESYVPPTVEIQWPGGQRVLKYG